MTKTDRQAYVVIAIVILIAILVTMLYCIPAKAETITVDGKVFEQYVDSVAIWNYQQTVDSGYIPAIYIEPKIIGYGPPVLRTRYIGEADSMVPFPPDTVENWIIPKPVDTGRVVEVWVKDDSCIARRARATNSDWSCPKIPKFCRVTNCRIDGAVIVCDSALIEGR